MKKQKKYERIIDKNMDYLEELQKALELQPAHTTALYQLSTVYRRQGKTEEAQLLLRKFEEIKAKAGQEEELERKTLVQIMKTVSQKP